MLSKLASLLQFQKGIPELSGWQLWHGRFYDRSYGSYYPVPIFTPVFLWRKSLGLNNFCVRPYHLNKYSISPLIVELVKALWSEKANPYPEKVYILIKKKGYLSRVQSVWWRHLSLCNFVGLFEGFCCINDLRLDSFNGAVYIQNDSSSISMWEWNPRMFGPHAPHPWQHSCWGVGWQILADIKWPSQSVYFISFCLLG